MLLETLVPWCVQHQSLFVVVIALVLERQLPIPAAYHPMTLVRALALQLGKKVHRPKQNDASQQRLSGFISTLFMLLLCVTIPIILQQFSPLPVLLDSVVLLCCLSWRPMAQQLRQISQLPTEQQKLLQRSLLQPWLARDCQSLSLIGVRKAAVEAIYLRSWHDLVAPIFFYVTLGLWAALSYRIVLELSRCWHPKQPVMTHFGYFTKQLRSYLDFVPQLLWAGWLLLAQLPAMRSRSWHPLTEFDSIPRGALLLAASLGLQCHLGGPAYYAGQRHSRPRLQAKQEPQASHITLALRTIDRQLALLVLLMFCTALLT